MPNTGQSNPQEHIEPSYFSREVHEAKRFYHPQTLASYENPEPYSVISGGWECCDKDYGIDRSNFPYIALEFVISGQGTLIIDDKKHALIPGVFFSYGPDKPHIILMDKNHPLEKYFVNIQCLNMDDFFGPDTAYLYGQVIHSVRPYLIQQTFEELITYGVEHNSWSGRICNQLVQLLLLKISESLIVGKDYSGIAYSNYLRCVSVLNQQYRKFRSLEDITEACGIDASYLCKLFKKFSHQSPYQYFLRLNMNHAADLLLRNDQQVQEVAELMNFADPLHFSRTFKKVMGISPSAFVKLSKGSV